MKAFILASSNKLQMKSDKPVYEHLILDIPIISYVQDALGKAKAEHTVVTDVNYFTETPAPVVLGDGSILLMNANLPFVTDQLIQNIMEHHSAGGNALTVFHGPGQSFFPGTGITIIKAETFLEILSAAVSGLGNDKDIYQLTEVILGIAQNRSLKVEILELENSDDLIRVTNRIELANANFFMSLRINYKHMMDGVTFLDASTCLISPEVTIGIDTVIYPGCIITGKTVIGKASTIGPNSHIVNSTIGDNTTVENSVMHDSSVGSHTSVGPFAYLRPHSQVGDHCKIGDFVEVKNSVVGNYTKASHLTYLGDADIGEHVNFGCGTVIVNYDSKNKSRSVIKDNAFIGCNSNIVSPVTVGDGAFTAAGSTITIDVPEKSLAIARARQVNKTNWKGIVKK